MTSDQSNQPNDPQNEVFQNNNKTKPHFTNRFEMLLTLNIYLTLESQELSNWKKGGVSFSNELKRRHCQTMLDLKYELNIFWWF